MAKKPDSPELKTRLWTKPRPEVRRPLIMISMAMWIF